VTVKEVAPEFLTGPAPGPHGSGPELTEPNGVLSRRVRAFASTLWTPDLAAISVLVAIPVAVFFGADLFGGHLLLSGDNLIQNFPERVLVGSDLRHGILPFWDPFVWSGTPLLAGLSAGAFYPTTLLFAVVSSHAAWVLGQIFVFSSIGVGTYLLFRSGGTSPLASFLGAFSFTFAGAVASQTAAHIDMGDGLATLPWALLAVRRIGEDSRWRWTLLLAGASALTILAGSPEAILDTGALCAAFALFRCLARRGTLRRYATRVAAAGALAVGLTAFLWIPALHFLASSQRPAAGELFASEYSFPASASVFAVVPYLEGGFSLFSQPAFFGQSNLEEVAAYVGILPLIATFSLLVPYLRRRLPRSEVWCWYGILVVGVLLATAAGSPLERLLYHIPFYGTQRNTGRNIIDADLAVCALFAWWVDAAKGAKNAKAQSSRVSWLEKVLAFLPLGAVGFIAVLFLVSPTTLWIVVRASPPQSVWAAGSGADIALAAGITAAAGVLVLFRSRMAAVRWRRLVVVFVIADIAMFSLGSEYLSSSAPPDSSHPSPVLALVKQNLSTGGRYAVFDPDLFDSAQFPAAGEPDVGILDGLPSFSGYGPIVNARYAGVTASQVRAFLSVSSLGSGAFEPLGLQVLVTVPESFLVPIATLPVNGKPVRVISEQPGTDPVLEGGTSPPPRPPLISFPIAPARTDITAGSDSGWWFGTSLSVRQVALELGTPSAGQLVRVGTVSDSGAVDWGAAEAAGDGATTLGFGLGGSQGEGIAVQVLSGPPLESVQVAVSTSAGRAYLAGGVLADAVNPGGWAEAGSSGDFSVFKARYTPTPSWLQPVGSQAKAVVPSASGPSGLGSARIVSSAQNSTTIEADADVSSLLVWSSAWDSGWRAELVGPAGDRPVSVERVGLVQGVVVPAGTDLVRFTYEPTGLGRGLIISSLTGGIFVVACVILFVVRRRSRVRMADPR
jgi:hypothetical protein